jgi:hypothetical protein
MDYNFNKQRDANKFVAMVNTGEGIQYCEVWEVGNQWQVVKDKITDKYYPNFTPLGTPPTFSPYMVEIPLEYRLPFKNGVFKLNDFEVPLDDYQNTKVVNLAYFEWTEFRAELDTKDANGNFVYQALKDAFIDDLWKYVELQIENNNLIEI